MALRLTMPDCFPPLVGIAGAGSRGSNFARRYLEVELLPEDRQSGCCLMALDQPPSPCPPTVIVIAFAGDAGAHEELAAWAGYLQSSDARLALFCMVGDQGPVELPGPYVLIPDNAATEVQLTAALNCVARSLVGYNLVNLRGSELREVCQGAKRLFFATGRASGEERAQAALDQALDAPGMRDRIQSARGVWGQVAASQAPLLWEAVTVIDALHNSTPDGAVVWAGGTHLQVDEGALRVSLLVAMN
jgi:hypothetical protein